MSAEPGDGSDDVSSYDILSGMREWRSQHPHATLREIEHALDQRWYPVRARMLTDLALQSRATQWQSDSVVERPVCSDCGRLLVQRGRQPRHLKTHGDQDITLMRTYLFCPACKRGHFPPR